MSSVDFEALQKTATEEIERIKTPAELEAYKARYAGRKGVLAELTGAIPGLPKEERGLFGQRTNALKRFVLEAIEHKAAALSGSAGSPRGFAEYAGLPGVSPSVGKLHPITAVIEEICALFERLGFSVADTPEVETEFNNFTGLNIPLEHPSRDAFDTFYLKQEKCPGETQRLLLRSHTSPGQVRMMKQFRPPLAVVIPGRVYRPDAVDASHSFMFHQIEGFLVDRAVTFADLKGVLELFAKGVFGEDIRMRLRPHFFPFTEPSAEVDISCIICKGRGCSVCGRKGWLEILGAGMIHPAVFETVGYGRGKFSGFAFGMGVERIAMLKYGIDDIRLFFENDLRFLDQF